MSTIRVEVNGIKVDLPEKDKIKEYKYDLQDLLNLPATANNGQPIRYILTRNGLELNESTSLQKLGIGNGAKLTLITEDGVVKKPNIPEPAPTSEPIPEPAPAPAPAYVQAPPVSEGRDTVKLVCSIVALVLGIGLIIAGIVLLCSEGNHNGSGQVIDTVRYSTDIKFGTDYYTTLAQTNRFSANALSDIYALLKNVFGILFIFLGGLDVCWLYIGKRNNAVTR